MRWILSFFILVVVGCGPKAIEKELRSPEIKIGPRLQDKAIDLEASSKASQTSIFKRQPESNFTQRSFEIFELSETLFDLASREVDPSKRKGLFEFGEKIHSAFYRNPRNTTYFDADSTTYLELALGLTYDGPPTPLKDMIKGRLNEQQLKIAEALSSLKSPLQPLNSGEPDVAATVVELASFLESLPSSLSAGGVSPEIVNQIRESLNKEFIPLIREAAKALVKVDPRLPVTENIETISSALKAFTILPSEFLAPLLAELEAPKRIGTTLQGASSPEHIFEVLFSLWLLPNADKAGFESANQALYEFLNGLSLEDIHFLREYNRTVIRYNESDSFWERRKIGLELSKAQVSAPSLTFQLWWAKDEVEEFGVERVRFLLNEAINKGIISEFDSKLRSYGGMLVSLVSANILGRIKTVFDTTLQNLKDILRGEGKKQLRSRVFVEESKLPGLEDGHGRLKLDPNGQWTVETSKEEHFVRMGVPPRDGRILTDARTLGTATASRIKRLMLKESLALINPSSYAYQNEVFITVNRLMAIGGFKFMEPEAPRFQGGLRKIRGAGSDYDMDMFNYDLEPGYFAVPDQLIVTSPFKVEAAESRSQGLVASVAGSAEITRGSAVLMYYMRDWERNGFDAKVGQQEYEGVKIFPKDAFYALGLGVGSVPLRNLTREGTIAFGNSGKVYGASVFNQPQDNTTSQCPEPEGVRDPSDPTAKPDPVVAAALVDVGTTGEGDVVDVRELARFVLAADQFIRSTDNVERSAARPLHAQVNGFKATMKAVLCGRRSVKTLMIGLANFMISRLQMKDGGFARYYSLSEKRIVAEKSFEGDALEGEPRFLEDQLLVIQALRKVFDRWQGHFYRDVAIDTYYYLNTNLFSYDSGFYREVDVEPRTKPVDVRLYSMAIETLLEIEPFLSQESKSQASALREMWTQNLIRFGNSTK